MYVSLGRCLFYGTFKLTDFVHPKILFLTLRYIHKIAANLPRSGDNILHWDWNYSKKYTAILRRLKLNDSVE
jgi:hypothetical protein